MEKIELYRMYIQKVLTDYVNEGSSDSEVRSELVFDTIRDHYQVVYAGWDSEAPDVWVCFTFGHNRWKNLDSA